MNYGIAETQTGKFGNMLFEKLKENYKAKKIFITGHTGFKGSWLLKILNKLESEVRGFSLSPESKINLYELIHGDKMCDSIISDIKNRKHLINEIQNFQPDYIFHLAAQPLVRTSYEIPVDTFEVNALGTANLLDAVKVLNKRCQVILITTDKVYHNYEWDYPYREFDRLGGYDPYSASKACAEIIIDSYRNSFFNNKTYDIHGKSIASARAGNVIGGGDFSRDRIIPDIVRSLVNNEKVELRNPNSVRPWQHVIEPIVGYLQLGMQLFHNPIEYSNSWNFGPFTHEILTVKSLTEKAIKIWGAGEMIIPEKNINLHEANLLSLDISKAVKKLNWMPKFNCSETIELTINWYKKVLVDHENADLLLDETISNYFSK
jgi:CDP-glucose 4,6-dehydratase